MLLPLLADIPTRYLVPNTLDVRTRVLLPRRELLELTTDTQPPPVYAQGYCSAYRWHHVLHLVHRASARRWSYYQTTRHPARWHVGVEHGREPNVVHQQHGHLSNVRTHTRSRVSRSPRPLLTARPVPDCFFARSNAPDFASRATTPSAAVLPQLFAVPLGFSIVSFIGIIVSSSSQTLYGEAIWSPIDLLGKFLDDDPSHATRFGVRPASCGTPCN